MKKDVVMYKNGSIVDFQGKEHQFVVCALSTSAFNEDDDYCVELECYDDTTAEMVGNLEFPRAVFIGVAICNPVDKWDEEKGKMIALNKAKGFKPTAPEKSAAIFATRAGMISEELVKALLDREVKHIEEDPEYVIKGYNKMKAQYEQKKAQEDYINETPENLRQIADTISKLSDDEINRVVNVALIKSNE